MFNRLKPFFNTHMYLVAGYLIGTIATSIHFVPWTQESITFADIGGMMAGFGTIGLFVIACNTRGDWKRQILREHMEKWFISSLNYQRMYRNNFLNMLFEYEDYPKTELQKIDKEVKCQLRIDIRSCKKVLTKIEAEIETIELLMFSNKMCHKEFKVKTKGINDYFGDTKYFEFFKTSEKDLIKLEVEAKNKERQLISYFSNYD